MNSKPDQASEGRIPAITARWEGFDWSCNGKAEAGVQAVKDITYLLDQVRVLTDRLTKVTAEKVMAQQGRALELMSRGSAAVELENKLREQLALAEIRAEEAESSRLLLVRQLGELRQFADAYRRENEERERLVVELQKAELRNTALQEEIAYLRAGLGEIATYTCDCYEEEGCTCGWRLNSLADDLLKGIR